MYLTKHIFLKARFVKYVKAHEKYAYRSLFRLHLPVDKTPAKRKGDDCGYFD